MSGNKEEKSYKPRKLLIPVRRQLFFDAFSATKKIPPTRKVWVAHYIFARYTGAQFFRHIWGLDINRENLSCFPRSRDPRIWPSYIYKITISLLDDDLKHLHCTCVTPTGKQSTPVISDNHDGTYTVDINANEPGVHTIDVALDGNKIPGELH